MLAYVREQLLSVVRFGRSSLAWLRVRETGRSLLAGGGLPAAGRVASRKSWAPRAMQGSAMHALLGLSLSVLSTLRPHAAPSRRVRHD